MKICSIYRSDSELIAVVQYPSRKFYILYGYTAERPATFRAGWFDTLEEAVTTLKKHRPLAQEVKR